MKKLLLTLTILCFLITSVIGTCPVYAQEFRLPAPGVRVGLSPEFSPPILKGIKVHPDNPFRFDFIMDKGDSPSKKNISPLFYKEGLGEFRGSLKQEATRLIKYFLASLTIPEKDLWVNLSPYEKDRIIPQSFGLTEMGRDLLAEDYMLKQITASLIYPEDEIGKKFWKRIYQEAAKKFGTTNIPVNTFNKVWIVPEKAVVYENTKAGTAYVVESKLKVMLEQDYLALKKNGGLPGDSSVIQNCPQAGCQANQVLSVQATQSNAVNALGSSIVRQIIIPELTKEVNQGKNFSQLRQVYNSLILATWYKKKIKDSILAQVYADKNKVKGLSFSSENNMSSPNAFVGDPEHIYQQYLKAFKKGAYNYIKEEQDPLTQEIIPRKYFSGGADLAMIGRTHLGSNALRITSNPENLNLSVQGNLAMLSVNLERLKNFFRAPDNLQSRGPILLPGGADVLTRGRFRLPRFGRFMVQENEKGELIVSSIGGGWATERTTFRVSNIIFNMMYRIEELDQARADKNQPIVIVDWGGGTGLTLRGLLQALHEREQEGRGIPNVILYGFANEYYSEWRKAEKGIHFILDTADHLKDYLAQYEHHVQLVYSIRGLEHLFADENLLTRHLKDLRDLLDINDGRLLIADINPSWLPVANIFEDIFSITPIEGIFSLQNEIIHPTEWKPLKNRDSAQLPEDLLLKFREVPEANDRIQMEKRGIFYLSTVAELEDKPSASSFISGTTPIVEDPYVQDKIWEGKVFGQSVSFLKQKWQFAFKNFLIYPDFKNRLPQIIRQSDLELAVQMVKNPPFERFRIGFGSLQGGASLNRLHLQGFALSQELSPLEEAETENLYTIGDILVEQLKDYPMHGLLFSGGNIHYLSSVAYTFIHHLQENNIPHTVTIAPKGIYVMPVKKKPQFVLRNRSAYATMGFTIRLNTPNMPDVTVDQIITGMRNSTIDITEFQTLHQTVFSSGRNRGFSADRESEDRVQLADQKQIGNQAMLAWLRRLWPKRIADPSIEIINGLFNPDGQGQSRARDALRRLDPSGDDRSRILKGVIMILAGNYLSSINRSREIEYLQQIEDKVLTPALLNHMEKLILEDKRRVENIGVRVFSSTESPFLEIMIDNAMTISKKHLGGIDLTPAHMHVEAKTGFPTDTFGDDKGIKFHLDPAMMQELQNALGFVPVIINVQLMTDLRKFLGIASLRSQ